MKVVFEGIYFVEFDRFIIEDMNGVEFGLIEAYSKLSDIDRFKAIAQAAQRLLGAVEIKDIIIGKYSEAKKLNTSYNNIELYHVNVYFR